MCIRDSGNMSIMFPMITSLRELQDAKAVLEEGVLCPGLDVLYQTMDDLAIAAQKQSTLLLSLIHI